MIDLRNYGNLIRACVKQQDAKDPNWKWAVKSIGKTKVQIRWGYLDYMEEKENCFFLVMDNDAENTGVGDWLWARTPCGGFIECYLAVEGTPNPQVGAEMRIESAIKYAIEEIAYVAHSRY